MGPTEINGSHFGELLITVVCGLTCFFLFSQICSICLYFYWDRHYRCADLRRIPFLVTAPLWTGSLCTRTMLGLTLGAKEKTGSQPHLGLKEHKQQGRAINLLALLACCVCVQKLVTSHGPESRGRLTVSQVLSFWRSLSGSRAGEVLRLKWALRSSLRPTL